MTTPSDIRFAPAPEVLYTELDDSEAILLHTRTLDYFSLNETGVVIWKALGAECTLAEIAAALLDAFEVGEAEALAHAERFVADAEAAGLLVRHGAG